MIPFNEWLPDTSDYGAGGATIAQNVYPRDDFPEDTPTVYGPVGTLSGAGTGLNATCYGAGFGRDTVGNINQFAGDQTALYRTTASVFSDVSKTGGYNLSGGEQWEFLQFANAMMACNPSDPIQRFVMGTDTKFSDTSATAPKARHIAEIKQFLVAANTVDGTDGAVPYRIWRSGLGDETNWPTPGTSSAAQVQSGFTDLPGSGWCQKILGAVGGADGAAIFEDAIYRITYVGPPAVFQFDKVERSRGTPIPGSVINIGPFAFYISYDGLYVFDGLQSQPIGAGKVDKWLWANINGSYLPRVSVGADPLNKLIVVNFPGLSSTGTPDTQLIWNWKSNKFSYSSQSCEFINRNASVGYNLDNADSLGWNVDTSPYGPDAKFWTGGQLALSGFDTSHKLGQFNGANLLARVETSEYGGEAFRAEGKRIRVRNVRPIVDGGSPTVQIGYRESQSGSVNYSTATSAEANGKCPQNVSTRYCRFRVNIPAGSTWQHARGVEVDAKTLGNR